MLIKSIFRLKTYTAVLIISMLIFSMSIPLSITLAKSYGETRAEEYAYLIRPHARIKYQLVFSDHPTESFQALYYILKHQTTNVTVKSILDLIQYINIQTTIKWLNEQSENPLLANYSQPTYEFLLGQVELTRKKLINLTGIPDNERKNLIRENIEKLSKELSRDFINKYLAITGKQPTYSLAINPYVDVLTIDENHTLILARQQFSLTLVLYSEPQDLWHLGFKINKPIPDNVITIDKSEYPFFKIFNVINEDNKLTIGNSSFNTLFLSKDTSEGYGEETYYAKTGITIYMSKNYFKNFITILYNDDSVLLNSYLDAILSSLRFTAENNPQFVINVTNMVSNKPLVAISPSIIILNGYTRENSTEKINIESHRLAQLLLNLGATNSQINTIVNGILSKQLLEENLLSNNIFGPNLLVYKGNVGSSILIEYNATFIYSSSFNEVRKEVGSLYSSLVEKYNNLTEYISERIEELGKDKPPYSYLIAETPGTVTGEYAVTYGPGYEERSPSSSQDILRDYYKLQAGIVSYDIELSLASDKLFQITSLRTQTWDPIGAMSLASLIPIVLMIGYFTMGESLETIFATSRKWLATSVARGAYLKKFITKLKLLFTAFSIIIALVGVALSGLFISLANLSSHSLSYIVGSLYKSSLILAPTLTLVPLIMFISARGRLSKLETLSPLESQRMVESIEKHAKSRRRTVGTLFLLIIVVVSLMLGLSRPNLEHTFDQLAEKFGGAGVAILAMIVFSGIMISPFSPLIVLYYAVSLLSSNDKLFDFIDSLVARLMGRTPSGELSVKSSLRLKEILRGPTRTAIVSLSVVFGTILSRGGLLHYIYPWLEENRISASLISGLIGASRVLLLVGAIGAVTILLVYPIVLSRTFDYIRGHVAILRARGGDKKTIISYVYGSFLPSIIFLILASLLGGLLFVVSMDSVIGIAFIDYWGNEKYSIPHLFPWSNTWYLLLFVGIVLFFFLLPIFLAYRVASVRDLAKYLREEVF